VRDCALAIYAYARTTRSSAASSSPTRSSSSALDGDALVLVDEVADTRTRRASGRRRSTPGCEPAELRQAVRARLLETLDWNKTAPGPRLPAHVIAQTSAKYREACSA
jgi:phosphoribosylaminoimidazole-succinocarboxamide synthase